MNRYTIYCTPEQTKKALELGAPIMTFGYGDLGDTKEKILSMNKQAEISTTENGGIMVGQIPTAEQMIGWLEEEGFQFNCNSNYLDEWEFLVYTAGKHSQLIGESDWCENKKEATLAAIDAALEYLTNKK